MEGWPSPVDGNSLENCQGGNLLASSNLAPSAFENNTLLGVIFLAEGELMTKCHKRRDSKLLPARL